MRLLSLLAAAAGVPLLSLVCMSLSFFFIFSVSFVFFAARGYLALLGAVGCYLLYHRQVLLALFSPHLCTLAPSRSRVSPGWTSSCSHGPCCSPLRVSKPLTKRGGQGRSDQAGQRRLAVPRVAEPTRCQLGGLALLRPHGRRPTHADGGRPMARRHDQNLRGSHCSATPPPPKRRTWRASAAHQTGLALAAASRQTPCVSPARLVVLPNSPRRPPANATGRDEMQRAGQGQDKSNDDSV